MARLLKEVFKDVTMAPQLTPLIGLRDDQKKTALQGKEAGLEICGRGLWQTDQIAFFDIRVFNPFAKRYFSQNFCENMKLMKKRKKSIQSTSFKGSGWIVYTVSFRCHGRNGIRMDQIFLETF